MALTWLNPHVYLDTVLLLGGIAATHGDPGRWWFAAGASLASLAVVRRARVRRPAAARRPLLTPRLAGARGADRPDDAGDRRQPGVWFNAGMTVIGIVSPGAMGSALGRAWAAGGARVVATVDGRSARTRRLAHGLELLPTLADVVAGQRPGGERVPTRRRRRACWTPCSPRRPAPRLSYADLNAISPALVESLAERAPSRWTGLRRRFDQRGSARRRAATPSSTCPARRPGGSPGSPPTASGLGSSASARAPPRRSRCAPRRSTRAPRWCGCRRWRRRTASACSTTSSPTWARSSPTRSPGPRGGSPWRRARAAASWGDGADRRDAGPRGCRRGAVRGDGRGLRPRVRHAAGRARPPRTPGASTTCARCCAASARVDA